MRRSTVCHPQPFCHLSALAGWWFAQFSAFPHLRYNQWIESELLLHLHPGLPPPDHPPPDQLPSDQPPPGQPPPSVPPFLIDHGLQVHVLVHTIRVWWKGGAFMGSKGNLWERRVLDQGGTEEGARICSGSGLWGTTHAVWIFKGSGRVHEELHKLHGSMKAQ